MVVKDRGGFKIKSHTDGHMYPKIYKTKEAAEKRISQMQFWKHVRAAAK